MDLNENNFNGETKKKLKIFLPVIFSLLLIAGMIIGFKLQESYSLRVTNEIHGYDKLNDILNYINARYVDTVNNKDLREEAINGMLKKLDPHSAYIPSAELKAVNQSLEGNFEGIGIEFFIVDDTIMVVAPISGGPSEALGIMSGDKIIKIEDKNVAGAGITNQDVVSKLRGDKGTKVTVSISRSGNRDLIDFTIIRDKIPIFSVDVAYMVDNEVGYIKINRFAANTFEEFAKALDKLQAQGMKKLILDLRDNPGGYLNAAISIADEFLDDKKLIVYTQGKSYERYEYTARKNGFFEEGALAILINQGSASASEIVAGAVQDWDRGVIVGRRSFGKGLVQEQFALSDSSALRLTVARYYTPSGRCIQKSYRNGFENYYREIDERFSHGELENADSVRKEDTVKFFTSKGKVVYGGGGIMPDVFVPLDTTPYSKYFGELNSKGIITQFAYHYASTRSDQLAMYKDVNHFKINFLIDEKLLKEFFNYASAHGVVYDEKGFNKSKAIITLRLKAFMAQQLWNADGFYPVVTEQDEVFQKAYSLLKQK